MSSVTFVYFKTSMQVIPLSSLILDVQEEDEHMAWSAFGGLWVTHHNEGNTFGWASGITVSIPLNKKWGTEVAITYKNQVTKVSFILLLLIKLANQNTLQTLLTRKLSFWTFFFLSPEQLIPLRIYMLSVSMLSSEVCFYAYKIGGQNHWAFIMIKADICCILIIFCCWEDTSFYIRHLRHSLVQFLSAQNLGCRTSEDEAPIKVFQWSYIRERT